MRRKRIRLLLSCLLFVLLPFLPAKVLAATLGCEGNVFTFGVDYGDSIDSGQTWELIDGDPIKIAIGSGGSIAAWACQPDGLGGVEIVRQYYSEDSWGTNVWLNGTDTGAHYASPYYSGDFTEESQTSTTVGNLTTVETVLSLGSSAQLKQVVTYRMGDYYYKLRWELTNMGEGDLSDVRFFHGGDAYFGGDDSAYSWWDGTQNKVYVNNSNFDRSGIMAFWGSSATPADHYFGGDYDEGNTLASSTARLNDTTLPDYVDAGYQLEWDRATLAAGATWIIEAFQGWTDPTSVQILAPGSQLAAAGTDTPMEFLVHNLDPDNARTFTLSAVSDLGWAVNLSTTEVTVAALERAEVLVDVSIPGGAALDTVSRITLTAEDEGGSGSGATTLTVFSPSFTITPTRLNMGMVAAGSSSTRTVTVSNEGSSMQLGTVASPNDLDAPFSISADACSGQTLANGESCTIEVTFSPAAAAAATDSFNIPILTPVTTSVTVTVLGNYELLPSSGANTVGGNFGGCFIDTLFR